MLSVTAPAAGQTRLLADPAAWLHVRGIGANYRIWWTRVWHPCGPTEKAEDKEEGTQERGKASQ